MFLRWACLPYGTWLTGEGRQILFNRFYEPIWQRLADGSTEPADPTEWVQSITDRRWFYHDGHNEREKRVMARAALRAWSLPEPSCADIAALQQPIRRRLHELSRRRLLSAVS
jgi:hypothetical protein